MPHPSVAHSPQPLIAVLACGLPLARAPFCCSPPLAFLRSACRSGPLQLLAVSTPSFGWPCAAPAWRWLYAAAPWLLFLPYFAPLAPWACPCPRCPPSLLSPWRVCGLLCGLWYFPPYFIEGVRLLIWANDDDNCWCLLRRTLPVWASGVDWCCGGVSWACAIWSLRLRFALGAAALLQCSTVRRCERWILSMSGLALYSSPLF